MKQKDMKQQSMMLVKRIKGFTLIELMIVVAIVSIIASIAYGSYQDSVRKTKRAEAKTALMNLAQQLERCYTANGAYNTACTVHDGADLVAASATSQNAHYNLAIGNLTATTFTLTATATFADPECLTFSVTHTGLRTGTGTKGNACW